ncbi:MAG: hypothetical protein EHM45_12035 [Desulfobacteraceae bacterium]|nr:MAG: hypothetical protein EHM45_12035 [Desulfobacteraceae bacterium]
MTISSGVVIKNYENGIADVRMQEQDPGIIGAPGLNVCHSASPGSIVVTQALNPVRALAR